MCVDIAGVLLAVDPGGRVAALPQVRPLLRDASGTRSALLARDRLEVGHAGLFAPAGGSFPPRPGVVLRCPGFTNAPVDVGRSLPLHIVGDVGIDVQRGRRRHMAQHSREGLDVHAALERQRCKGMLPKLDYWKRYTNLAGAEKFTEFKQQLINEINALHIDGMPKVEKLNALVGGYVNLEYRLPNGKLVKFLDDGATYLGNQLECEFGGNRCFGIAANMDFILICTYEENGENPELVVYKKR